MVEFFEPPDFSPEPSHAPRLRVPPWVEAPKGSLPGAVALDLVLASNGRVAVCVTRLEAYPVGFGLELITMARVDDSELDPLLFEGRRLHARRGAHDRVVAEEMLRFGVEFADGSKATNTGGQPLAVLAGGTRSSSTVFAGSNRPAPPAGPVLRLGGGGGGGAAGDKKCGYGLSRRQGH